MKTLSEVLRDGKLSYRTLVKYVEMGIIPKPQRIWRGRKGSESLYSDEVVEIINRVRSLQKRRFTLREIAEQIKKELGQIEVMKPTEEYLIPIKSDSLESYLNAYRGFHNWLNEQIEQQMSGYEFHSVEMEKVYKNAEEFLRPKDIKVKPKAKHIN
jgi:DNA-binding transcriptional MerR regulator